MIIPLQSAENAVAIPLAAVFSEEGQRYAYVRKENDQFEIRPIRIGVADFQFAEVLDGLQNGDVVSMVRPENPIGDLQSVLSKLAANNSQEKTGGIQSLISTNSISSTTNQSAPKAD
jgi:hypothetical protein